MRGHLTILVALFVSVALIPALARNSSSGSGHLTGNGYVNPSSHYVPGYYRHDGTYVHGYHATDPNQTGVDNYSTKGNVNPWTGVPGTHYVDK